VANESDVRADLESLEPRAPQRVQKVLERMLDEEITGPGRECSRPTWMCNHRIEYRVSEVYGRVDTYTIRSPSGNTS